MAGAIFYIAMAYLIGSIPTGHLLAKKVKGIDIRKMGSGNIGATNMTRVLGRKWGAVTLLVDILKSFCVISGAHWLAFSQEVTALVAYSILLGNCFSLFLKGRGGKGVATSVGIYLAIYPPAWLAGSVCYLIFRGMSGVSAIGSLAMQMALPVFAYLWLATPFFYMSLAMSALIIVRHRANIRLLL